VEEVDLFPGLAGSRSIGQRILENNRRIRSHGAAR
jgi:hypothetical protein